MTKPNPLLEAKVGWFNLRYRGKAAFVIMEVRTAYDKYLNKDEVPVVIGRNKTTLKEVWREVLTLSGYEKFIADRSIEATPIEKPFCLNDWLSD